MPIRIPQNLIQFNYTSGKEYMDEKTYEEYQGHYYKFNNKVFAGKEFNSNAPTLISIPKDTINLPFDFNKLLTQAATYIYGRISGTKINTLTINTTQYINDSSATGIIDRYFTQKANNVPILIKEINKEMYSKIANNPLYKTVIIKWNRAGFDANEEELKKAEKQMPGITDYLRSEEETISAGDAHES